MFEGIFLSNFLAKMYLLFQQIHVQNFVETYEFIGQYPVGSLHICKRIIGSCCNYLARCSSQSVIRLVTYPIAHPTTGTLSVSQAIHSNAYNSCCILRESYRMLAILIVGWKVSLMANLRDVNKIIFNQVWNKTSETSKSLPQMDWAFKILPSPTIISGASSIPTLRNAALQVTHS